MTPSTKAYTKESFQSFTDIEHIRNRKSMYIGGGGLPGVFMLDKEIMQNVIDEYNNGFGDFCIVKYDSVKKLMHIEDFGRGIPVEMIKRIFTQKQTSGKYDDETYDIHAGSNGVGNCVVSACSKWLKCEVYRDGYFYDNKEYPASHGLVITEKGICTEEKIEYLENGIPNGKHVGTTVEFIVDEEILDTQDHDIHKFLSWLNLSSWLNNGFEIHVYIDGNKTIIKNVGGTDAHIRSIIKEKGYKPLIQPLHIAGQQDDENGKMMFSFNIAFTYGVNNSGDSAIVSYVNGFLTPEHGTHVRSFKTGCSLALTQYIGENDFIPKALKGITVSGSIISDNIIAIVGVSHRSPYYDTQTKDALKSTDIEQPIINTVKAEFYKWLINNQKEAKRLVDLAIDYAKYELERKKLKKSLIDSKQTKSIFDSNSIDPTKYKSCRSNDPNIKELFIVEGTSAAGGNAMARDSNFQALYSLTGKIFNVAKSGVKSNLSKVILDLVQLSGMGLPVNGKPKYENRAFDKFIILTDADDDGAHIQTLLLTFFWTFYPKIVEEGHVYVAKPPIKKLIMKNGTSFYINTEADYNNLMKEYIVNTFELRSCKTHQKLSEGLFRAFIDANVGYNTLMDNHANSLAINPRLLEMICININLVSRCTEDRNSKVNKEFYNKTGYYISRYNNTDLITFDRGVDHTNLKFDEIFLKEHFDIIVEKLNEIAIYGVYLHGIRSNHDYYGTLYSLNKCMESILGNKVMIKRYKGLGEQEADELAETVINPTKRTLTKVTVEDIEKADKSIKLFMTDLFIDFKRKFYAGTTSFD